MARKSVRGPRRLRSDLSIDLGSNQFTALTNCLERLARLVPVQQVEHSDAHAWRQIHAGLRELLGPRLVITAGVPGIEDAEWESWIGACWAVWPEGIPSEPRWIAPSSRLSRALDLETTWFRRLRAVCEEVRAEGGRLVVVAETAGSPLVRHAARRTGVARLEVALQDDLSPTDVRAWWSMTGNPTDDGTSDTQRLWLCRCGRPASGLEWSDIPRRDRVLITLGQQCRPLSVRKRGQIARLLSARGWLPPPETLPATCGSRRKVTCRNKQSARKAGLFPEQTVTNWPWPALVHWTRRCDGPWPGQSDEEYWDELLDERPERARSALATLVRIVGERRLRASNLAIRGGEAMVCWAQMEPQAIATRRVFRRHRQRWDFEPFGIAVQREWLEQLGARPVVYGGQATWDQMAEADRPWFQKQTTRENRRGRVIDWQGEREWRVRGDIELSVLTRDQAMVFVPDVESARIMEQISPWPVRIVAPHTLPESTECA